MPIETEVKIKIDAVEPVKQRLLEIKAELYKKRALEQDVFFDNKRKLEKSDQLLRLRDNILLTYKGPKTLKQMKVRQEIEVMIDNKNNLVQIFEKLGYIPSGKKEKYRESYVFGMTKICVDETPMGNFIEIEGTKKSVITAAEKLGFSKKQFIAKTYNALWDEHAGKNKIKGDMVFQK